MVAHRHIHQAKPLGGKQQPEQPEQPTAEPLLLFWHLLPLYLLQHCYRWNLTAIPFIVIGFAKINQFYSNKELWTDTEVILNVYFCPQLIPYDWWKRTIMTSKCDTVEDKWLRSLLMSTSLTAFAPEDTWAYPQHFRMRSKQLFPMDGSLPVSFLGSSSTDWYKDNWLCHRTAFFVQKAKWSGFCNGECVGCSAVCPAVCNCACAVCFGGEGWGVIHDVGQNHYHKWIETTPAREPSLQAMDAQNT